LMGMYGLYQAMSEGVSKALISETVPAEQRAGAIGLVYMIAGFSQLAGSLMVGLTWSKYVGHMLLPFALSAAMAIIAAALLMRIKSHAPPRPSN